MSTDGLFASQARDRSVNILDFGIDTDRYGIDSDSEAKPNLYQTPIPRRPIMLPARRSSSRDLRRPNRSGGTLLALRSASVRHMSLAVTNDRRAARQFGSMWRVMVSHVLAQQSQSCGSTHQGHHRSSSGGSRSMDFEADRAPAQTPPSLVRDLVDVPHAETQQSSIERLTARSPRSRPSGDDVPRGSSQASDPS